MTRSGKETLSRRTPARRAKTKRAAAAHGAALRLNRPCRPTRTAPDSGSMTRNANEYLRGPNAAAN